MLLERSYTLGASQSPNGFHEAPIQRGLPKPYTELHETLIQRGLSKAPMNRGICKAPRGSTKLLYRGIFAKLRDSWSPHTEKALQSLYIERPLQTPMQGVGINMGHVINFTIMRQESPQEDQYQSEHFWERTVLVGVWTSYAQSTQARAFVKPLLRGSSTNQLYRGWVFVKHL